MIKHVQSSSQLLLSRKDKIEKIRQLSDPELPNWDDLYGALIHTAAEFYQHLPTRGETYLLLDQAMSEAINTLYRYHEQRIQVIHPRPNMVKYFALSASLYFNFGHPLADLEVKVKDDGDTLLWNPLLQPVIGPPGTAYYYRWTKNHRSARCTNSNLAFSRLPEIAQNWLVSDRGMLNAWFSALNGEFTGNLAPLLRYCDTPIEIPAERLLQRFILYLRTAIARGRVNRQRDPIHRVKDGLFLEYPEVFNDFSVLNGKKLYEEIVKTHAFVPCKTDPENLFWRFRTNNRPNHVLRGLVLDMKQHELSRKVGLSAYIKEPAKKLNANQEVQQ